MLKKKVALVALSAFLVGAGVICYLYGPKYYPQLFATTSNRILSAAFMGGAGLSIDLGLLISHCRRKPVVVEELPQTVKEEKPVNRLIYYETKDGRFLLARGSRNLERLALGKEVDDLAVEITSTVLTVKNGSYVITGSSVKITPSDYDKEITYLYDEKLESIVIESHSVPISFD